LPFVFKFSCSGLSGLVIDPPGTNVTCIWSAGRNTGDSHVVWASSDCVKDTKRMGPETLTSLRCTAGIGAFSEDLGGSDDLKKERKVKQWEVGEVGLETTLVSYGNGDTYMDSVKDPLARSHRERYMRAAPMDLCSQSQNHLTPWRRQTERQTGWQLQEKHVSKFRSERAPENFNLNVLLVTSMST
jgi:hypothetical protein